METIKKEVFFLREKYGLGTDALDQERTLEGHRCVHGEAQLIGHDVGICAFEFHRVNTKAKEKIEAQEYGSRQGRSSQG